MTPVYLYSYAALQKTRWQHFYHLKPVTPPDTVLVRGDLRHYRQDLAALFDPASPNLIPGELLQVPGEAMLHKLDMMERPQYRRVKLAGVWLDVLGWVEPWAYEFAGPPGLFVKLLRAKQVQG